MLLALLFAVPLARPAAAQTLPPTGAQTLPSTGAQVLPATGTTVQVGALRQQLEGLMGAGAPAAPGWTFTPALGVEQRWTNNLQQFNGQGGSSFITALMPSLLIGGETSRTNTTISYAPEVDYYTNGNQVTVAQNLNATSHITVVPERVFLDLSGFAGVQPTYGGFVPLTTGSTSSHSLTQTLGFSAHPYVRQPFGDYGTAELGGIMGYTSQYGLTSSQPSSQPPGQFQSGIPGNGQNSTSMQEYLSFASGPVLGRTSAELVVSASQFTGTGVLDHAHRDQVVLNLGYAVTHTFTALASVGYENLHYSGVPPYSYIGPQWSLGGRWIPNPDSSVTAVFGSRDGKGSGSVDAGYAPTARSRLYAHFSEGLTSGMEQLLNAVSGASLDAAGNPVDRRTGAPVQLDNGFYGLQNNLAQVISASVTGSLLTARDAFSLTLSYQQSSQVAAASVNGASGLDTVGWYGTLSWQRDLRPDLSASASVQWGTNQYTTPGPKQNFNSAGVSVRLSYAVSPTLNAYAQYTWTSQTSDFQNGGFSNVPTSLIIVGARKVF